MKIRNFVSLRFVFIMLIFLSHVSCLGFPPFDFGGECGVAFFFMLSGFVLSLRYGKEIEQGTFRHRRFFWHQFSKFYPLHIAVIVLSMIVGWRVVDGEYLLKLIPTLLLVQSWIPDQSFYFFGNGVSWFLSDMLFIYAVFPFVYKQMHKSRQNVELMLGMVLIAYVVYLSFVPEERHNDLVYAPPLLRMVDFGLGIVAYRLMPAVRSCVKSARQAGLLEHFAVALGIITYLVYPSVDSRIHCVLLFWPMCMAFILVFAVSEDYGTPLSSLLHTRWLTFCGGLAFEIFLMQYLIIVSVFLVMNKLGMLLPPVAMLFVCVCVTVFVCYLTKRYFTDRMARVMSNVINKEER